MGNLIRDQRVGSAGHYGGTDCLELFAKAALETGSEKGRQLLKATQEPLRLQLVMLAWLVHTCLSLV